MIEIPFIGTEILFTIIWLALRIAVNTRKERVDWRREALLLLMYVNLAVIIRFVFFPMEMVDGKVQPLIFDPATALPFRINLVPFVRLSDYAFQRDYLLNNVGNVAMFIPTGIILPIIYQRLDSFWKVVLTGALISICIEILQLPFSVRASDIDDLILNTAGVAIGYAIYKIATRNRN